MQRRVCAHGAREEHLIAAESLSRRRRIIRSARSETDRSGRHRRRLQNVVENSENDEDDNRNRYERTKYDTL